MTSTHITRHFGIVAFMDALGVASLTGADIDKFMDALQQAMEIFKTEDIPREKIKLPRGKLEIQQLNWFKFNDTVIITLRSKSEEEIPDQVINFFFRFVRLFFFNSLIRGILFRGACAIGDFQFHENDKTIILGEAISDAAAWYDKPEWIGLITTPRTTLHLLKRHEISPERTFHCLDYSVPMKEGRSVTLKALNWRTVFTNDKFKVHLQGQSERVWFLNFLASRPIPFKTEAKYFNSLAFFDACEKNKVSK